MNLPVYLWIIYYLAVTIMLVTTDFYLPCDDCSGWLTPCSLYTILIFAGLIGTILTVLFNSKKSLEKIHNIISKEYSAIAGGWYRITNSFLSPFSKSTVSVLCRDKHHQQLWMASLNKKELRFDYIPIPPACTIVRSQGIREAFNFVQFKNDGEVLYFLPCDANFKVKFKDLENLVRELNQRDTWHA